MNVRSPHPQGQGQGGWGLETTRCQLLSTPLRRVRGGQDWLLGLWGNCVKLNEIAKTERPAPLRPHPHFRAAERKGDLRRLPGGSSLGRP